MRVGENIKKKKIYIYIYIYIYLYIFLQSSYNELLLITSHCSSMLKILRFIIFDIGVFLSFEVLRASTIVVLFSLAI